jgi:hypothetical protein
VLRFSPSTLACSSSGRGYYGQHLDRIVEIANFANQRGELDLAKPLAPAAMLDFRNAQQRRDRGQRLVETGDRLIGNCAEFLQR